jgi:hypothetical protein
VRREAIKGVRGACLQDSSEDQDDTSGENDGAEEENDERGTTRLP